MPRFLPRRAFAVALLTWLLVAVAGPAAIAAEGARETRVSLSAELACAPDGGAYVTFTVQNTGPDTVEIDNDFHLQLTAARSGGLDPIARVFVWPAPGYGVIAPADSSTFWVPIAVGEEGEPGADLRAERLILDAEVFFKGTGVPVTHHFTYPGCNA